MGMSIVIETTRKQLLQLAAGIMLLVFLITVCAFWAGGDSVRTGFIDQCEVGSSFSFSGHEGVFICVKAR